MIRQFCFLLVLVLALSGCLVGSSHPFYTADKVIQLPALNGDWYFDESMNDEDSSPLKIENGLLTIFDKDGIPASAQITFFQIDDTIFADIFPNQGKLKEELAGDHDPIHLISRVKVQDEKVSFNALDYDWLAKEVDEGRIVLPHERITPMSDILFTATEAQWVEFLKKYRNDPNAFPSQGEAFMQRNKPPVKSSSPDPKS